MVLVADSVTQLNYERIEELGINIVEYPLYINGEPYPVSISMSREEKDKLRELLMDKKNKGTTSGLKEDDLLNMYKKLKGEKIISLHQSFNNTKVTGEVLNKVKEELSDYDIEIFDSYNIAGGYTIQVLEAAKAIKKGIGNDELLQLLKKNRENTKHLGAVFDLFYLQRSGRLGLVKAVLGSAMKIIPLLSSTEESGVLKSIGKAKTYIQANQIFIKRMEDELESKNSNRLSVAIVYGGPREKEAQHLKELIASKGWDASVELHYTNHSCMPHEGPDFYDFGYIIYED